jgi:putative aldouronate transport system substrate-binding protein
MREVKKMRVSTRVLALILCAALLCGFSSCVSNNKGKSDDRIVVRLAAPQNNYIEDFNTNWYKLWLEEQTGLKLEITWLPMEDAEQIARQQLQSGEGLPDAYIGFGSGFGSSLDKDFVFSNWHLMNYAEQGVIIPLNELIEQYGGNIKRIWEEYPNYRLREFMTASDGKIYFIPGSSDSLIKRYRPLMFVNKGWLDTLGLDIPKTTGDFYKMLKAFATLDPNGNGLSDEIPLCGTETFYNKQPSDFIINAFIYNDDKNDRLYPENGRLKFAPVQDGWRDALRYLRMLCDEGLYPALSFSQDDQQMKQMANDPRDILGAFTASNISYTVYQNSPEMMARYIGIAPLMGPEGIQYALVNTPQPKPNAVITSACQHPAEVFKLFDLMMGEEASIYSRFGEKGVDWENAADGDISIFGTQATVQINIQLYNLLSNKTLQQITPHFTPPKYSMGITWDGTGLDGDYITAQTVMQYQAYDPPEHIVYLKFTPDEVAVIDEIRVALDKHVKSTIRDFVLGVRDVNDDTEWQKYLLEFDGLGLQKFVNTAQTAYDRMK